VTLGRRAPIARLVVALSAVVAGTLATASGAGALSTHHFFVGSTTDSPAAVSQATCLNPGNTSCTFRDAIKLANNDAGTFNDTVSFLPSTDGVPIQLAGTNSPVHVLSLGSITIAGNGPDLTTISGSNHTAALVFNAHSATATDLTVADGYSQGSGAGVTNQGTLVMRDVVVTGNVAHGDGGGMLNTGTLTMSGSEITSNAAISGCGGGLANHNGTHSAILDEVVVSGNGAQCGGGINAQPNGNLTVERSLIEGNIARNEGDGGGVYIGATGANTTLVNDTIAENVALEWGGGVHVHGNLGTVSIKFDTIVNNSALQAGGGVGVLDGHIQLGENILAGNTEGVGPATHANQCINYGTVVSLGYNVVGGSQDPACIFGGPGDRVGVPVALSALGAHGGPTLSYLPLAGDVAIAHVPSPACPTGDQRGAPRPSAGAHAPCDAGSVEVAIRPGTISCGALAGHAGSTATLSGCTPSAGGHTSSASFAGALVHGGTTTVVWHSGPATSIVSVQMTSPGTGACPAHDTEAILAGAVVASSASTVAALSRVSMTICESASGALSLLRGTRASL
jgi:hypothetical protein